jgi:hypothetical protein
MSRRNRQRSRHANLARANPLLTIRKLEAPIRIRCRSRMTALRRRRTRVRSSPAQRQQRANHLLRKSMGHRRMPGLSPRKGRCLTATRRQGPAPGRSTPVFEGDGGDQRKPAEQPVNRVSLAKPAVIEYSIARQDSYNLRRRRRICHSISHPVSTQKKFHPR